MIRSADRIYDELLVLRCQDGSRGAFEELVARWQQRLWRHAWHLTGNRDAAWDVLQETWMAIVRGIRRLEDPARFQPWAYRIVTNKCADWVRGQQRERRLSQDACREAPEVLEEADEGDETDLLRAALGRLPRERRALLSLRYLDGISIAELAEALDIPEGTVKSRLHHARNQLKEVMERRVT